MNCPMLLKLKFINPHRSRNIFCKIIGTMSKFRINTDESSDSKSTSLKPPCFATKENVSPEVKQCCQVFDGMFQRTNTETIMALMKYSLELSHPWITQYYPAEKEGRNKQTLGDNRLMYKAWLATSGNEMLNLISKNGQNDFLEQTGYLDRIKFYDYN